MSNNIINLLDDINILQNRKNNIDELLKLINVPQSKTISQSKTIPMLELYEYELKGYTDNPYPEKGIKFTKIVPTEAGKCGIIIADKDSKYDSEYKSSCDSISSDPDVNDNNVNYATIEDKLYYTIPAKSSEQLEKVYVDGMDTTINLINNEIDKLSQYIKNHLIDNNQDMSNYDVLHSGALIYHIKVDNNEKIIVIGDLHGGFHTFWRHIKRFIQLGILSENLEFKKDKNYRIIFLGDILDRGKHAHDILNCILQLMHKNNTNNELRVIYNRGNHEEDITYNRYGFRDELISKDIGNVILDYYKFFSLLSSAIILESDNSKIWLSHGGFPIEFNFENDGKTPRPSITNFSNELKQLNNNKILFFKAIGDKLDGTKLIINIPEQIKWNDFGVCHFKKLFTKSSRGGDTYLLSPELARFFCTENNINYIIRGHQDSYYNSYIVINDINPSNIISEGKDRYPIGSIKSNDYTNDNFMYINKNNVNIVGRNAVHGPIARIHMTNMFHINKNLYESHLNHTVFYPVITLSSNTDTGRTLTHDSYGILRFDKNNLDFVE